MRVQKWALVLNERSGSADEHIRPLIETTLRSDGREWTSIEIQEGESAADKLADAETLGVDGLLVAGGDGTVMEVVNGIARHGLNLPLAIVPTGTANFVARALDVPQAADEALAIALGGTTKRIDVGQIGDRYFVLGVGLGLAERFVTTTEDAEKRRLGPWAYLLSLLRELRTPAADFIIEPNGAPSLRIRGVAMVVANTAGLGKGHSFDEQVKPDDGVLDVVVLRRLGLLDSVRLGVRAIRGNVTDDPAVTHAKLSEFTLQSRPKVPIQIDGDDVTQTLPLPVRIHPLRLSVFISGASIESSRI